MLIFSIICPVFFFSNEIFFCHRFLSTYESQRLQILYILHWVEVYCVKENHDAEIYFALFLPFSFFLSLTPNAMHREICVKGFSGTAAPRILKFATNSGYHYLYCIGLNQHPNAYHSLYLSIFLFYNKIFEVSQNAHGARELQAPWTADHRGKSKSDLTSSKW